MSEPFAKSVTVGAGEACDRTAPGLPLRRCTNATFEYKTDSYMESDGPKSWRQHRAIRTCTKCKGRSVVDVTFDVPRVIKTAERWASWWAKIDGSGR